MVTFNYETDFAITEESRLSSWITNVIVTEGYDLGELNYIFCDDAYLLPLNIEFLKHDTLTDIISFDNTMGKLISGDIYISIERVMENAKTYNVSFSEELHRVMIHGVLHYLGYKDKSEDDLKMMRAKGNEAITRLTN